VQEQTLTRDQQALEQLQAEQVRNEANLKVRALLDGLRTVFHHSAIPRDRVVAYMERLNNRIADYATRLHAPFSMYIDPESLRPMAQFADRVEPLAQLSGGQFTLAAWSWHLALYEEHGGQVGFIVMDEPTVALDSANIRNVAEVVQYLNRYCAESGLQFLMVTHESDLASGFVQQATLGAA
jgi:DNA repair exonuclease SbcCD ATPase subunit